jgi:hypothetical protein
MGALRHFREDAVELLHLHRAADHSAQSLGKPEPLPQLAGRGIGGQAVGGAIQNRRELVHGKGLGQVVRGPAAHGFDGGVDRTGGGHGDHCGLWVEELDLGNQFQALARSRRQIDQKNVGGTAPQQTARLAQISGAFDGVAQAGGDLRTGRADGRVRIHHQQVQTHRRLRELGDKLHISSWKNCFEHSIRLMHK